MAKTIEDRCREIVAEHLAVDRDRVKGTSKMFDDLGADSLDQIELVMTFEEEFGVVISDDIAIDAETFADVVKVVEDAVAKA